MKNKQQIQILRGQRNTIINNKSSILKGQPVFDKTDNYLFIGDDSDNNRIKQPITTNRLIGYFGDSSGLVENPGSDHFNVGPASSEFQIQVQGKPLAINDDDTITITSAGTSAASGIVLRRILSGDSTNLILDDKSLILDKGTATFPTVIADELNADSIRLGLGEVNLILTHDSIKGLEETLSQENVTTVNFKTELAQRKALLPSLSLCYTNSVGGNKDFYRSSGDIIGAFPYTSGSSRSDQDFPYIYIKKPLVIADPNGAKGLSLNAPGVYALEYVGEGSNYIQFSCVMKRSNNYKVQVDIRCSTNYETWEYKLHSASSYSSAEPVSGSDGFYKIKPNNESFYIDSLNFLVLKNTNSLKGYGIAIGDNTYIFDDDIGLGLMNIGTSNTKLNFYQPKGGPVAPITDTKLENVGSITYNYASEIFEFSKSLSISGNITATNITANLNGGIQNKYDSSQYYGLSISNTLPSNIDSNTIYFITQ